jgi:hypothetical protein
MMIVMVLSNTIDGHKEITTQRIELDSMDTSTTCLIIDLSKNKNEAIYKEKKSELLKEVDLKKTSISYVEEEKPFLIKQVTKYPISYLINWFVIHGNDEKYIFYLNNYSIKFKN